MEMETTLKRERERSGSVSSGPPSPQIKKIRCEESDGEENNIILQNRVGCDTVYDKVVDHDDIVREREEISLYLDSSTDDTQSPSKNKPSVSHDCHQTRDEKLQMNAIITEVFPSHTDQEEKSASSTLNLEKCQSQKNNSLPNNEKLFKSPLSEVHGDFVRNVASTLPHDGAENVAHSMKLECCETPLTDPGSETVSSVQSSRVESESALLKLDRNNPSKELVLKIKPCDQKMISKNCSDHDKPLKKEFQDGDSILKPAMDSCDVVHSKDINPPSQPISGKETSPKYASGTDDEKPLKDSFSKMENETQNPNSVQLGKELTKMPSKLYSVKRKQNSKPQITLSSKNPKKAGSDSSSEDEEPLQKSGSKKTEDKKNVLMSSDSESEDNQPLKKIILKDTVIKKQNSNPQRKLSSKSLMKASSDSSSEDDEPLQKSGSKKTEDKNKVLMSSDSESEDNQPLKKKVLKKDTVNKKQNYKPQRKLSSKSLIKASSDSSSEDKEPLQKSGSKKTEDKKKILMSSDSESEDNQPLKKKVLKKDTVNKKQNYKPQRKLSSKSLIKASSDSSSEDKEPLQKSGSKKTEDKNKVLMSSDSESEDNEPLKKIILKDTVNKKQNSNPQRKLSSKSLIKASSDSSSEEKEPLQKSGSKKTEDKKKVLMSSESESEDNQPLKKIILKDTVIKKQNSNPQRKLSSKSLMEASSDSSSEDDEPLQKSGSKRTEDKKKVLMSSDSESEDNQPLKKKVLKKDTVNKKQNYKPQRKLSSKSLIKASSDSSSEDKEPLQKSGSKKTEDKKKVLMSSDSESEDNEPLKKIILKDTVSKKQNSNPQRKLSSKSLIKASSDSSSEDKEPLHKSGSKKTEDKKKQLMSSDSESGDNEPLKKLVLEKETQGQSQRPSKKEKASITNSRNAFKASHSSSKDDKPLSRINSKTIVKSEDSSVKYDRMTSKTVSSVKMVEGNLKNVRESKKVVSEKKSKKKLTKSDKNKKGPTSNSVLKSRSSDISSDEMPLKKLSSHLSTKQKSGCASPESSDNTSHDKPLQKSASANKMVSKIRSTTKKGERSNISSPRISTKSKSSDSDSDEDKPLKETIPEISHSNIKQENFKSHQTYKSNEKSVKESQQGDSSSANSISDSQSESASDNSELLHNSSIKKKSKSRNHDCVNEETIEKMSCNDSEDSESEKSISQEKEKVLDDDTPLKQKDSDSGPEPSLDSEPEESNVKEKKGGKAKSKKTEDPHKHHSIVRLKKYLHAAGIRVANYDVLWKECKSIKSRASKLQLLLEKAGMNGRPTIEKCKKLKEKRESEREMSELSKNIILTEGRRSQRKNSVAKSPEVSEHSKKLFSRIKTVFNSDSESE